MKEDDLFSYLKKDEFITTCFREVPLEELFKDDEGPIFGL